MLNQKLGTLVFAKVEYPWKFAAGREAVRSAKTAKDFTKAIASVNGLRKKLDNLGKGYKYEFKNFAESVIKDGIKLGVKAWHQYRERTAWSAYFEKDIEARLRYPALQVADHFYWQAYDEREALLQEKAALLGSIDPSGFEVVLSKPFDKGTKLTMTLVEGPQSKHTPFQVWVGGKQVTTLGGGVYAFDSTGMTEIAPGAFALEIR